MKQIEEALEYALMLLSDQASKGNYPDKALQENGGSGFLPIIKGLEKIKEIKP